MVAMSSRLRAEGDRRRGQDSKCSSQTRNLAPFTDVHLSKVGCGRSTLLVAPGHPGWSAACRSAGSARTRGPVRRWGRRGGGQPPPAHRPDDPDRRPRRRTGRAALRPTRQHHLPAHPRRHRPFIPPPLAELINQLPDNRPRGVAANLADLLGIHPDTANRWSDAAGGRWYDHPVRVPVLHLRLPGADHDTTGSGLPVRGELRLPDTVSELVRERARLVSRTRRNVTRDAGRDFRPGSARPTVRRGTSRPNDTMD